MATGPMITVHGPGFRHPAGMTVEVVGLMTKAGVPVVFERFLRILTKGDTRMKSLSPLSALLALVLPLTVYAAVQSEAIEYRDGDTKLKGYLY